MTALRIRYGLFHRSQLRKGRLAESRNMLKTQLFLEAPFLSTRAVD